MREYVGIDLGTTNCAICSYNGAELTLYKSPDQQDVTPSAIYIDRRGNKYVGLRAYGMAAQNPDSAATLFKRFIGTSTPIKLSDVGLMTTPEECSTEMLRVLYGYLPDRIRNDPETGTVITVPAAFNQMQKDATMGAARAADIGSFALMQEPVAAVMSAMRSRHNDGLFVIFDLGGGTLDIAIAQSISGHVSLLAHGGIAMCGGRDFDRIILDNIIRPWLVEKFDVPSDFAVQPDYKPLLRMATLAGERAKIRLSSAEDTLISDPDFDSMGFRDQSGKDIFLDVPLSAATFNSLISEEINKAVEAARETIEKASLTAHDIDRVVFVGGPTQYKPLRDRVAFELGIAPSTDINPMTAVAEGAALFAESVDWSSQARGRKSSRGSISAGTHLPVTFAYLARTPEAKARISVKLTSPTPPGCEFQVDSLDTGWSSGRFALSDGASLEVALTRPGDNAFKVFVFDPSGGSVPLENASITISKTAATIDAIPSSSSIAIEALDRLGGRVVPVYLVKQGDQLPAKGRKLFKAAESLRSGGPGAIQIKLWEGEIQNPITDNRPIGALTIVGSDFDDGIVGAGDEIVCDYQVLDSGNIRLEVTVPSIHGTFRKGNFYSRQTGQVDLTDAGKRITADADALLDRVQEVATKIQSPKLDAALSKLHAAAGLSAGEADPETTKKAMDEILEAKTLLARVRTEHGKEMRQLDLDHCVGIFNDLIRPHASAAETGVFDNLARAAQRSIDEDRSDFDTQLDELRGKGFQVLWRQDWFVVDRFHQLAEHTHLFPDRTQHASLVSAGLKAIQTDDINTLRRVVFELDTAKIGVGVDDDMLAATNIVRV
jgi:molecular chaperone DnaK